MTPGGNNFRKETQICKKKEYDSRKGYQSASFQEP
jgi:hypothetical protein